jgi:hypothetical protein
MDDQNKTEGSTSPRAVRGDGQSLDPRDGVIPVIKELEPGILQIVGTACWITRYGLFLTAQHVLATLVDEEGAGLEVGFVAQLAPEGKIYLRRILRATLLRSADLAVGQADNYLATVPDDPLSNMRAKLTTTIPPTQSDLTTYAYPENTELDFRDKDTMPIVVSDYSAGLLLRHVTKSENPWIPYPHFETSIEVKSGASGGPVFDHRGRVIGVNCRGWDFRGAEHEGNHLSSIVPIEHLWSLEVPLLQLPPQSWEHDQIPQARRGAALSMRELADYGHLLVDQS